MADIVDFPAALPLPTFEGYGIEPLDAALRTEMESGPARQRLQYTDVPDRRPVRWRFSRWEFAIFEAWYKFTAKRGAEYFRIELLNGLGMVPHVVRFIGRGSTPYQAVPQRGGREGVTWIVTSALEVRDSPGLSEQGLEVALSEGDIPGLLDTIDGIHTLIHTTLPGGLWA